MNQREVGAKKEEQAGEYLKSCGYELEAKNYHCRFGEIDIIAREGKYLCFVEVKYRKRKIRCAGRCYFAYENKTDLQNESVLFMGA